MWFDDNKHVLGMVGMCVLIMQVSGLPSLWGNTPHPLPPGLNHCPGSLVALRLPALPGPAGTTGPCFLAFCLSLGPGAGVA